MPLDNLLDKLPDSRLPNEQVDRLADLDGVRVERIVSTGHASPDGFWYDQDETEWVLLVAGAAGLRLEGEPEVVRLRPGDFLTIPAHRRHRVEWTSTTEPTVWLALFARPAKAD